MQLFKKMNYGLIALFLVLVTVFMYIVIATAVNYADQARIDEMVSDFVKALSEVDVTVKEGNKTPEEIFDDYEAALKKFYTGNADSFSALANHLDRDDWDRIDYKFNDLIVNFTSFTKASATVDFRNSNFSVVTTLSFELIKVGNEWKIASWRYGDSGYRYFDDLIF